MKNFTNGAIVFRVWPDGSGEIIAKFQYFSHAKDFAAMRSNQDLGERSDCTHFYLAVCEAENEMQAYRPSALSSPVL
ncbi:hypothetical protein [Bradyrhizobium sp. LVM 105]|uniref:hypothetical protein n=1 Tax=Bradyrhizobium sp. LVM 105 TaxID=2341115 RepID=UPI000F815C03|nr:hypothetical protein [Bradyrhizobium sp. LVM 105]RTE91879.1 hypothetical protein D6B98_15790 [Bradyrhizobium sp. LVM 105]